MMNIKLVTKCLSKGKQQGVALITVMLIVALSSIIAAQMTTRLQTQMQRSTNISFNQQAYWYAMGAEAFSKRVLLKAFKDEPKVTHLEQIWAQEGTSYPVDFGEISGEISDLQSCLNLNALHPEADTKEQVGERESGNSNNSDGGSDSKSDDKEKSPAPKPKTKSDSKQQLPAVQLRMTETETKHCMV